MRKNPGKSEEIPGQKSEEIFQKSEEINVVCAYMLHVPPKFRTDNYR